LEKEVSRRVPWCIVPQGPGSGTLRAKFQKECGVCDLVQVKLFRIILKRDESTYGSTYCILGQFLCPIASTPVYFKTLCEILTDLRIGCML